VASLKSLASPGTSALTVQSDLSKTVRIAVSQHNVAAASWNGNSPQYAMYLRQYGKEPSSTSSGSSGSPSSVGSPTQDLASIIGSIPPSSGPIPLGSSASTNYVDREMNRRKQQQCNQQQQRLVLQPNLQPLDFGNEQYLLDDFMA